MHPFMFFFSKENFFKNKNQSISRTGFQNCNLWSWWQFQGRRTLWALSGRMVYLPAPSRAVSQTSSGLSGFWPTEAWSLWGGSFPASWATCSSAWPPFLWRILLMLSWNFPRGSLWPLPGLRTARVRLPVRCLLGAAGQASQPLQHIPGSSWAQCPPHISNIITHISLT